MSLQTLSLLLLLAGNNIPKSLLLSIGVIIFTLSTTTMFLAPGVHDQAKNVLDRFYFYPFIGGQVFLGLSLGLGCCVVGCDYIFSVLYFPVKIVLAILAICYLTVSALGGTITKFTNLSVKTATDKQDCMEKINQDSSHS